MYASHYAADSFHLQTFINHDTKRDGPIFFYLFKLLGPILK